MPLTPATILVFAFVVAAVVFFALWLRTARAPVQTDSGRLTFLEQTLAAEQASRQQFETELTIRREELALRTQQLAVATQEVKELSVRAAHAGADVEGQRETIATLRKELAEAKSSHQGLVIERQRLASDLAAARMELNKEQEKAGEKLTVLLEAKKELSDQFSSLANKILEEKSQRFAEQNKASLDQLLLPLKTQLSDFKGTVERVYEVEGKERSALAEQVKHLHELNTQLSADAIGLTNALKGSSKTQGNWGEMVLERILESAGLRKGVEYRVQESHTREDGTRAVPDVILHLPEGRHLIIDSKVSLLDYNDHVNAATEELREAAAASHLASLRSHFRGLSEKDYRSLHSLNTIDCVIMFVPIEPAFMLGIQRDPNLWTQAWEKNVLLVSPSTLLFVVRTVSHIWKQEQQRNQWQEIARAGGDLYDKFSSFVSDLAKLGEQLEKTRASYDLAFNKLKTGRGNLINRADSMRKLGLKVLKPLPENLVDAAAESADQQEDNEHQPFALAASISDREDTPSTSLLLNVATEEDAEHHPAFPR